MLVDSLPQRYVTPIGVHVHHGSAVGTMLGAVIYGAVHGQGAPRSEGVVVPTGVCVRRSCVEGGRHDGRRINITTGDQKPKRLENFGHGNI